MKGTEVYEGMPCNERSGISGWVKECDQIGVKPTISNVEGAFARDNKSPIARKVEKSLMLRHQTHSAMGLRNILMMSSRWRSCGQERNVSIYVVDELQREGH